MSNCFRIINLKKVMLTLAFSFCLTGSSALASDNVLQAIQIDGAKDSYNIILKSDDVAVLKKTIQASNKMILNLKGIRASKTINTIYNNTSNVDSVVVEPTGKDSVKIMIQADNANNAEVHFDTLRTPLGVLGNSNKQNKVTDEIVLNAPVSSYQPVYKPEPVEVQDEFSLAESSVAVSKGLKNMLKDGKLGMLVAGGLLLTIILGSLKLAKGNDSELKVGLSQGLKDREIDLYRNRSVQNELAAAHASQGMTSQNATGTNYGLRAYQQGTRSPYVSSEMQRQRPMSAPAPSVNLQQINQSFTPRPTQNVAQGPSPLQQAVAAQATAQRTAPATTRPKSSNIDSMKFLESMTKIYEKNGRTDLAQGLKSNMKKAKMNMM